MYKLRGIIKSISPLQKLGDKLRGEVIIYNKAGKSNFGSYITFRTTDLQFSQVATVVRSQFNVGDAVEVDFNVSGAFRAWRRNPEDEPKYFTSLEIKSLTLTKLDYSLPKEEDNGLPNEGVAEAPAQQASPQSIDNVHTDDNDLPF